MKWSKKWIVQQMVVTKNKRLCKIPYEPYITELGNSTGGLDKLEGRGSVKSPYNWTGLSTDARWPSPVRSLPASLIGQSLNTAGPILADASMVVAPCKWGVRMHRPALRIVPRTWPFHSQSIVPIRHHAGRSFTLADGSSPHWGNFIKEREAAGHAKSTPPCHTFRSQHSGRHWRVRSWKAG